MADNKPPNPATDDGAMARLLHDVAERSSRYLGALDQRPVAPSPDAVGALGQLSGPLPEAGI